MPRENRKRGKKYKAGQTEQAPYETVDGSTYSHPPLKDRPPDSFPVTDFTTVGPLFGPLDPDVKAYFRTVNDQLQDWQEVGFSADVGAGMDSNEERQMFFKAALSEMKGKECQLSTDPECSPVLERMLYSMDDFVRRVFTDSLAGSWLPLMADRFASHVCQTLLTVAIDTVARESRGIFPSIPSSSDTGELLTMTELIVNVCEEILPELPSLVHNAFASHVLRALLSLLAPSNLAPDRAHKHAPTARSKKSASWKARIGPMKPVIQNEFDLEHPVVATHAELSPEDFQKMACRILRQFRDVLGGNEVRALAMDKVACPVLQMLLELEASLAQADTPDSIMDRVLAGLVSESVESAPSAYVSGLFLDPTSSHLSESILSRCSSHVFVRLWDRYFADNLPRLAAHPVANFVISRGVERLDAERLGNTISCLHTTWSKTRKSSHYGILNSLIDRAGQLCVQETQLIEAISSMFKLTERRYFLPCVLRLQTMAEFQDALASKDLTMQEKDSAVDRVLPRARRDAGGVQSQDKSGPTTQGSLLLQSVLRLQEPHNGVVLESLHSLLPGELLAIACDATSSRVLDVALESSTVPLRSRKRLITSFIGQFHLLADDRIGSRVADRCLKAADPYLKEKVARSLIPHEQFLTGSHFGRYFLRNLRLPLLRRNPDQWKATHGKETQISTAANAIEQVHPKPAHPVPDAEAPDVSPPSKSSRKRKRKESRQEDEIEALFSGIGRKKVKGLTAGSQVNNTATFKDRLVLDADILTAIKSAPADTHKSNK